MKNNTVLLIMLALYALTGTGCMVAESKYLKKVEEADTTGKKLAEQSDKYKRLAIEHAALRAEADKLKTEVAGLTGEVKDVKKEREKLAADNKNLEGVLKAKSDSLSRSITDLREEGAGLRRKIEELEADNRRLKQEIENLQRVKEEKVREVSRTYEDLLKKMEGEISKGQVTISELKGKLTVNMVDAVLFDSGKAEVKESGLAILQKVVDILKGVKDKAIRIEGHTDNVQIVGNLAKKYPTNWELSAARAINVARFLQQQGIDPAALGAVAYAEHKPVAPNDTDEGRAKNRRIEIILVPADK